MSRSRPSSSGGATSPCLAWLVTPARVFPAMALTVSSLSFITTRPSIAIAAWLVVALIPWGLVALSARVPPMVVVVVGIAAVSVLVARYHVQASLFIGVVTCTWVAATGRRWESVVGVAGFCAASVWCGLEIEDDRFGWLMWVTGMLFGWFAGSLLLRQRALMEELESTRADLAASLLEQERKAMAREVHDIVGHSLTVALLNIAGARRHLVTNPAAAAEAMERAEKVSRDSLESVRAVVGLLSTVTDSQLDAPLPTGADVVPMLDQAHRAGLPLRVRVEGDPACLDATTGLTVVRLLQEGLANASRHAAGATIDVDVIVGDDTVEVIVANDIAPGRPPSTPPGLGVVNIRDRVTALSGTVQVGERNRRWVVHCVLPRGAVGGRVATAGVVLP